MSRPVLQICAPDPKSQRDYYPPAGAPSALATAYQQAGGAPLQEPRAPARSREVCPWAPRPAPPKP